MATETSVGASGAMNLENVDTYLEGWFGPRMVSKVVTDDGWILSRDIIWEDGRVASYTVRGLLVRHPNEGVA